MERLTEWNGGQTRHAYYPRCFKEPCYGSGCKIKDCQFETAVCERLAAYEDIAELCGGVDRLRELAEADKAGRCVVLPCKVGDTVWFTRSVFRQAAEPIEAVVLCAANHGGAGLTYTTRTVNGGLQRKFTSGQIGKTVFLTREEAERAMEGKKNGNKTSL